MEQHSPGGRCRLHHRWAQPRDLGRQALAVAGRLRGADQDLGADGQGQEELKGGDVEADRGHGQQPVAGREPWRLDHRGQECGQRPVRHEDALGPAGAARGVDQVGGIHSREHRERRGRARAGQRLLLVEPERGHRPTDHRGPRGVADDQPGAAVGEHQLQPCRREAGVERQVGGAAAQNAEQPDEQPLGALQAEPDDVAAADAEPGQARRQGGVSRLQLAVAQTDLAAAHRRRLRRRRRLAGEGLGQQRRRRKGRTPTPVRQQPVALGRAQQGQGRKRPLRVGDQPRQQPQVVLGPAKNRRFIVEIGVVLEVQLETFGRIDHVERELVLALLLHALSDAPIAVAETAPPVEELVEEGALEHRVAVALAAQAEAAHQRREGQHVGHGVDQAALQPLQRFRHWPRAEAG